MRGARIVLVAANIAAILEIAIAAPRLANCKTFVMELIVDSCKGTRNRRSAERNLKNMEQMLNNEMDAVETTIDEMHANQQMRYDLYSFPEVFEVYQQSQVNLPGIDIEDTYTNEDRIGPPMPYEVIRHRKRSADPEDLLGFNLSLEDLDELYKQVDGDRISRNVDLKKLAKEIAMKCCPNPNTKSCDPKALNVPCIL